MKGKAVNQKKDNKKKRMTFYLDTNTLDALEEIALSLSGDGNKSFAIRYLAKRYIDDKRKQENKR